MSRKGYSANTIRALRQEKICGENLAIRKVFAFSNSASSSTVIIDAQMGNGVHF